MQAGVKLFFIFVCYAKKISFLLHGAKIEHFNLCQRLNIITTVRPFLTEKLR